MTMFRALLAFLWLALLAYTGVVIAHHGMGLLPIFFGDILAMAWPGQFNLDFLCMLLLAGLWVAWRHAFSPAGLLLGVLAVFGGAGFLMPYLLIASARANGDVSNVLLGAFRQSRIESAR